MIPTKPNTWAYCVKKLEDGTLLAQPCSSPLHEDIAPMDKPPLAMEYAHIMAENPADAVTKAKEQGLLSAQVWVSHRLRETKTTRMEIVDGYRRYL